MVETDEAVVVTDFKTARSRWSPGDVNAAEGQLIVYHELVRQFADKPNKLQFAVITKTKQSEVEIRPVSVHRMSWIKPSFLWLMERSGCPNHPPKARGPDCSIRAFPVTPLLHLATPLLPYDAPTFPTGAVRS